MKRYKNYEEFANDPKNKETIERQIEAINFLSAMMDEDK